jgi:hypothetical protein
MTFIMKLQDIVKAKAVHENAWCNTCHVEGNYRNECSMLGNYTTTSDLNLFPIGPQMEWCEIFQQWGHIPPHFPTL